MIPQHGPFSLQTMLEGPWLPKTAFPTSIVQPLDESQGSSPLQGHGSWLVCKVANGHECPWPVHTSNTLIGGKGGARPSSLHTMFEGQTEYVNGRWMWSLRGFLHVDEWIMFHGHLDCFHKPPLGGRPNTKPGDHGTRNASNHWFILFYHVWGSAWIEIHWNNIWLRSWSNTASQYIWGSVTTLHDFGGVLGRPLETFFWALTISWSRLLARVWSGPKVLYVISRRWWSSCYRH